MRTLVVLIFLFGATELQAQLFTESHTLKLRKSVISSVIEHADFNNDGLPDVLMINRYADGSHRLEFVKNDSIAGFIFLSDLTDIVINNFSGYALRDYDADNDVDIVLFGDNSAVYVNQGGFRFIRKDISLPSFTLARWTDLDNDGSQEVVGSFNNSGASVTGVFRLRPDSIWEQQGSLINLALKTIEIVEANGDGYKDLFVSGSNGTDSLFTGFLINQQHFQFEPLFGRSLSGHAAAGDLNGDGMFDIAFTGIDSVAGVAQKVLLSTGNRYVMRDTVFAVTAGSLFISDFNSDGIADISLTGPNVSSDTLHSVMLGAAITQTTTLQNFQSQQFLDFNRDGNLDLVRAIRPDSIHIVFYTNQSAVNDGPQPPAFAAASKIFNRYFLFWSPATDDHTVSNSVTYDVLVNGPHVLQPADFIVSNKRRFLTAHGNNLTQPFKLFDRLANEPSGFSIQSVDNSYHSLFAPNAICTGVISRCSLVESEATVIQVCPSESVTLQAAAESHWFSFNNGYLGMNSEWVYATAVSDTLFYYDPTRFDCSALKAFVIKINNTPSEEYRTTYACEDEKIQLQAEDTWQSVQWNSQLTGNLGQSSSIQYTVTAEDTVSALLSPEAGCSVLRKTAIRISRPEVTVAHDQLAMLKGTSVELQVFGADRYEWIPAESLSDASSANPIASPTATTRYTVTGYDSINCSAKAIITVTVESAGFVPTLFTPNDDGQNDVLRIFGLREVRSFRFTIHNREGKVVYETQSAADAVSAGWDGMRNGQRQPAGVYYWKVAGFHPSGEAVKLNGKVEGSIILVR